MHSGNKIKQLRQLKGLTQDELALKINKTRALVSHIEQTGKVNHYTLVAITKVLGISLEDFENYTLQKSLKKYINHEEQNENELKVLQEKLVHYQKENKLLQEYIESQKKISNYLEKGKK